MKRLAIPMLVLLAGCTTPREANPPATSLQPLISSSQADVEAFFSEKFPGPFETHVFPDRRALDAFAADRWKMPPTECWMVAMAAGPVFVLLDPADWKAEACEHDGDDPAHVRGIVTHELVHVFHGQHSPRPEFDGMDDMGWFVEGLAIFAAGQLDEQRTRQARSSAAAGLPRTLATAWSGSARYAVAGSLVAYLDETRGRGTVKSLLGAVSNDELLSKLGITEDELLTAWRAWVPTSGSPRPARADP